MRVDITNDEFWKSLNEGAGCIPENWGRRCWESIQREKAEAARRCGARNGESDEARIELPPPQVQNPTPVRFGIQEFSNFSKAFVIAARGEDLSRKVKAYCSVCKQPIRDNVNPEKVITCDRCVQALMSLPEENKLMLRESFVEQGDSEGARSVESFINLKSGKEITDEPTRKVRRTLERKRPMRKIRPPHGQRPFSHDRVLDQGRP